MLPIGLAVFDPIASCVSGGYRNRRGHVGSLIAASKRAQTTLSIGEVAGRDEQRDRDEREFQVIGH